MFHRPWFTASFVVPAADPRGIIDSLKDLPNIDVCWMIRYNTCIRMEDTENIVIPSQYLAYLVKGRGS
jgi:hypothetical protein